MERRIHIGDSLDDIGARFVDAWRRAERGGWICFAICIGIRRRASALGRDYRRVLGNVQALVEAGLLDKDESGLRAECDTVRIETRLAL